MIDDFLLYLKLEKNYSSHTLISYQTDLSQFCDFLRIPMSELEPDKVDENDIRSWVAHLSAEGLSARSIIRKLSALKSFWRFLIRRGVTVKNPATKVASPKTKKPLPVFLREKELRNLLNMQLPEGNFEKVRDLLIVEMLYMTGIRLSELISIEERDVDLKVGELRVTGKRNKQRVIPLHRILCEKINHYLHLKKERTIINDKELFVRTNGQRLYPKLVYDRVHELLSLVSTHRKVSPHVLRHSFATGMLNSGADIYAVKELLGHSSLAATQVYTHAGFDELHTIYKQAHPRAK